MTKLFLDYDKVGLDAQYNLRAAVKDAMHENVETVEGSEPLRDAAARMLQRKIGCLPVVEGERLAGILTEGDFLMLVAGESG